MSQAYRAVGWNPQKRRYDAVIGVTLALYLLTFVGVGRVVAPAATIEMLLIRGFGSAAALMLHVVLAIGPLARLDRRLLPLLYNRRHLGVTTFAVAAAHGVFAVVQFHADGVRGPLASVLVSSGDYGSLTDFPFQQLGLAALVILFAMAATSHDFWLRALSAPAWKALHMLVYVAYGLVVAHVALGFIQGEPSPIYPAMLLTGIVVVLGLHVAAGWRETEADRDTRGGTDADGFIDVCAVSEIPEARARTACLSGERVAVYRYSGHVSAVSAVCRHQNGPLAEGKVVGGCIVCPWHGYEYDPATGRAPAPFTERLPTFAVRVRAGRVLVHPTPFPPGTAVTPAVVPEGDSA